MMSHNTLFVLDSPFIIQLTLLLLLGMQVLLVPVHQGLIFLATLLHLISEFGVFLSDANLLLQTLLFIVQLAKAILKHHSLQAFGNGNFTKSPFIERELTSICLCLSQSFSLNLPEPSSPVVLFIACGERKLFSLMLPKPKYWLTIAFEVTCFGLFDRKL